MGKKEFPEGGGVFLFWRGEGKGFPGKHIEYRRGNPSFLGGKRKETHPDAGRVAKRGDH